jgi:hypothetical protein
MPKNSQSDNLLSLGLLPTVKHNEAKSVVAPLDGVRDAQAGGVAARTPAVRKPHLNPSP